MINIIKIFMRFVFDMFGKARRSDSRNCIRIFTSSISDLLKKTEKARFRFSTVVGK